MNERFKALSGNFERITETSYELRAFRIGGLVRTFETANGMFYRLQDADNHKVSVNISERDIVEHDLKQGDIVNGEYNSRNGYFNVIAKTTSTPTEKGKVSAKDLGL